MKTFTLKKIEDDLKITSLDMDKIKLKYKLRNNNNLLKVKEVNIINPEIINNLINYSFNKIIFHTVRHF